MTDNGNGLEDSSAKKLKSSTSANDDFDLNQSSDENSLSKETETKNENVALLFPNLSFSSGESVFSMDHLLESIFAKLDRKTLLSCRLVSRRWLYFSSKRLRKIVTLKFCRSSRRGYHRFREYREETEESDLFCRGPWRLDRTPKSLMNLMNSFSNFPCTSFPFENGIHSNFMGEPDPMAQRFFSAQGSSITKLQLNGNLLLNDLKRLFLIQAPNLQELIFLNVEFKFTDADYRLPKSMTDEERRRRRVSLFDETTIQEKPVFKNFKKYIILCGQGVPEDFLQQLLECSPNLVKVDIEFYRLANLLQPVNRLHLLRKLKLHIGEENMESLMDLANSNQNNWAIRKIILRGLDVDKDTVMASQASKALSKIFKGCSATCQKLRWHEDFNDFQIPPMHGLKHVHFCGNSKLPVNIFPASASLGDSFPDLISIKISFESTLPIRKEYLSIKNMFGEDEDDPVPVPLPNVKNVFLKFTPAQQLLESLQEKFPNAAIITSIED